MHLRANFPLISTLLSYVLFCKKKFKVTWSWLFVIYQFYVAKSTTNVFQIPNVSREKGEKNSIWYSDQLFHTQFFSSVVKAKDLLKKMLKIAGKNSGTVQEP